MASEEAAYLAFVKNQPCAVNKGCPPGDDIVPHHLRTSSNSGVAMKPNDLFCIPLCVTHHQEGHQKGWRTFQNKYNIDLWNVLEEVHKRWKKTSSL